jgi:hypothetical protein
LRRLPRERSCRRHRRCADEVIEVEGDDADRGAVFRVNVTRLPVSVNA